MSICSPAPLRGKRSRKNSVASLGEHFSSILSISSQVNVDLYNFFYCNRKGNVIMQYLQYIDILIDSIPGNAERKYFFLVIFVVWAGQ